jgi:DNA repair protein REV1
LSGRPSTASIGIGENRLLARIATRAAKPGGSFHLKKDAAIEHLAPLPLSILPGFGRSTLEKIKSKWGITTCGETRELKDIGAMQKWLGAGTGAKLWNFVRGIDDQELRSEEDRKTVSATINVRSCLPLNYA